MNDLVAKFTNEQNAMLELYAGPCLTSKSCLVLAPPENCTTYDSDSEVLSGARPDVLLRLTRER